MNFKNLSAVSGSIVPSANTSGSQAELFPLHGQKTERRIGPVYLENTVHGKLRNSKTVSAEILASPFLAIMVDPERG
jgi:hypothetical protein